MRGLRQLSNNAVSEIVAGISSETLIRWEAGEGAEVVVVVADEL